MISSEVFRAYGMNMPSDLHRFGSGLIHETYMFTSCDTSYLIQKLNQSVFKDLAGIMYNIELVSNYLNFKYPDKPFVEFIKAPNGQTLVYIGKEAWRLMRYISNSKSFDHVQNLNQAYEAGRIIGEFHSTFSNFEANQLKETFPGFHDFQSRSNKFLLVQDFDEYGRAQSSTVEINFLNEMCNRILEIESQLSLPIRVTHNDTKLNNILFDTSGRAICIVDLDTLMPGNLTFDTGDALRTMCNPSGEDGLQAPVKFDKDIFLSFANGFIQSSYQTLTIPELKSLPYSMIRMATEQAVRFLTDYLQGDRYYRQPFEGFNLTASKVQIDFIKLASQELDWMNDQVGDMLLKVGVV